MQGQAYRGTASYRKISHKYMISKRILSPTRYSWLPLHTSWHQKRFSLYFILAFKRVDSEGFNSEGPSGFRKRSIHFLGLSIRLNRFVRLIGNQIEWTRLGWRYTTAALQQWTIVRERFAERRRRQKHLCCRQLQDASETGGRPGSTELLGEPTIQMLHG